MNDFRKTDPDFMRKKAAEILPSMRYDGREDFDGWKERAGEKLYDLLGLPFAPCDDLFAAEKETDCGDFVRKDFSFQSEEGYFVPAALLVPKGLSGPLPVAVCIQGHTSGMHISLGVRRFPGDEESIAGGRDFARRAVKEGYCAVVLEQRYMGMCGCDETGSSACITRNAALPALLLGRCAIGERVWDVQRLLDILGTYFSADADMERIVCLGNSGGGTVSFYAACVDERIRLTVPSCAVCEFEDSIIPIHHCGCNYIPGIRKFFEMGDLGGLIAPRDLVLVCGVQDPIFPIEGVEKSYERIRSVYRHIGMEGHCRILRGEGGHRFYADLAWPVINELVESL